VKMPELNIIDVQINVPNSNGNINEKASKWSPAG
jgi:hypothetical protein